MIVIKAKPAVYIGCEIKFNNEIFKVVYIGEHILIIEHKENHERLTLWKNMIEINEEE